MKAATSFKRYLVAGNYWRIRGDIRSKLRSCLL